MRTAYCFTPDRAFFAPAVRAIASLIEAEPDGGHEIFLVCEASDAPPGFDKLARPLRDRIELLGERNRDADLAQLGDHAVDGGEHGSAGHPPGPAGGLVKADRS